MSFQAWWSTAQVGAKPSGNNFGFQCVLVAALLAVACAPSRAHRVQQPSSATVFREGFEDPARIRRSWIATTPSVVGALVHVDDETLHLTSPDRTGEVAVRHHLDLTTIRGKRVRVHARARTSKPSSMVRLTINVVPASGVSSYADTATTRTVSASSWSDINTVIDVARDAATAEVSLLLRGGGNAWFDDVVVSVAGDAPQPIATQLSARQLKHIQTLARVFGYVRFLHPSDQAATCDWDAFLPAAISQVLRVPDGASLRDELRRLFSTVAPTVTFLERDEATPVTLPSKGAATHLVRWRHFGLGPSSIYTSFREGRDAEEVVVQRAVHVAVPNPKTCRSARLDAKVRRGGTGDVWLFLQSRRPGQRPADKESAVPLGARELSIDVEIPADLQELQTGVRIKGRARVTLEALSLVCENGRRIRVEVTSDWKATGDSSLFRWTLSECETGTCGTLERNALDTELVTERDMLDVDVGSGVRMRMPTAVWSNANGTQPAGALAPMRREATINDLRVRLAAVSATWATLRLFYPYFEDQRIDWDATLPAALQAAAAARSADETHEVLSRLVARLQDDHARVTHAGSPIDGIVPVALRRFGDKLVVVGGLPEYADALPQGTEVLAIDGDPALDVYKRVHDRVSAATPGWHAYATAFYLSLGRTGTFRQFRFRLANGKERDIALPLISRDLYDSAVRESRPRTGAELAPGVYYVDFEALSAETWEGALPALQRARALIFDLRGYTTNVGMEALTYITDRELRSPMWQVPIVSANGPRAYESANWSMFPAATRLTAPVVVLMDGRSASAVETVLQMIREAKLAFLVGETSGGTNGNTNSFAVPGDFSVRFTGMRVGGTDGTTIQGHGITPDRVVHPTLQGVRAGRDEVLEAGVAEAQRLMRK